MPDLNLVRLIRIPFLTDQVNQYTWPKPDDCPTPSQLQVKTVREASATVLVFALLKTLYDGRRQTPRTIITILRKFQYLQITYTLINAKTGYFR